MIFKSSISIIYRAPSTFWLQWIILIVDDARDICSVADYSWYTSAMFLICSWCAPDMLLVRSDILAALQGPARRSGNLHAITQLYALDSIHFLNLIVALTSNGTRLGERKTPWSSQLLLTAVLCVKLSGFWSISGTKQWTRFVGAWFIISIKCN